VVRRLRVAYLGLFFFAAARGERARKKASEGKKRRVRQNFGRIAAEPRQNRGRNRRNGRIRWKCGRISSGSRKNGSVVFLTDLSPNPTTWEE